MIISRSFHVAENCIVSFFLMAEHHSDMHTYIYVKYFLKKRSIVDYHVVPISAVQQRDPVTPVYTFFFSLLMFHCVLSQETGSSSLCYRVGPHCLSILNVSVCIGQAQTPRPSHFLSPPPWLPTRLSSRSVSPFLFWRYVPLCRIFASACT